MKRIILFFTALLYFTCSKDEDTTDEVSNKIESIETIYSVNSLKSSCTITNNTVYYVINQSPASSLCDQISPTVPQTNDVQIVFSEPFECDAWVEFSLESFDYNINNGSKTNFQQIISPWQMVYVEAGNNITYLDSSCQIDESYINCSTAKSYPGYLNVKYDDFRVKFDDVSFISISNNSPNKEFLPDPNHSLDYYDFKAYMWCDNWGPDVPGGL